MDFIRLKEYMDGLVEKYNTPGIDCVVYQKHEQIFRYCTGMSDIENNKKMDGNELYLIFSMTKMLTCVCALQLFEQGKFLMSDPLSKYLPEFKTMRITEDKLDTESAAKIASGKTVGEYINNTAIGYVQNPIRIKDLFTMSAGFDYNLQADGIKKALAEGKSSTRELVAALSETILGFEPGTRFRYSLCHDIIGALIEVWSGMKFGEYMKKNLLDPLGMKDTFFGVPRDEARLGRMMARYTFDESNKPKRLPLECAFQLSNEYESGGAGLTSSISDYAIFLDALANHGAAVNGTRILSEDTIYLMRTNHLSGRQIEDFDKLRRGYGYGLGVRTHINKARSGSSSPIGEFGWDGAAGAFSMVDLENKLSFTYFQHIHGWDVSIQNEMRNILYSCIELKQGD